MDCFPRCGTGCPELSGELYVYYFGSADFQFIGVSRKVGTNCVFSQTCSFHIYSFESSATSSKNVEQAIFKVMIFLEAFPIKVHLKPNLWGISHNLISSYPICQPNYLIKKQYSTVFQFASFSENVMP